MSWEDQGRQYHMWFGHGTGSSKQDANAVDASVVAKTTEQKIADVTYGVIGALPAAMRRQIESQYNRGSFGQAQSMMKALIGGLRLDQAEFAARFFGREVDDPVARSLHSAALATSLASSHVELREATLRLAKAIRLIGVERWPPFLKSVLEQASDPATVAAIDQSRRPIAPGRDAIRPVYPIETILGVGSAALTGGTAAARAVGAAVLRQVVRSSAESTSDISVASAASVRDKLERYLLNSGHPKGGLKADWFRRALGFTRENGQKLAEQIVFNERTAVQGPTNTFGTTFRQVIKVVGANGKTIPVTTVWLRGQDGVARLITAFPGR